MAKTGVISASLRTEPHSAQSANSQPEPNDAFVDLHDFVFGDGENLASLKLHYLTLGTPRRDASGAIANGVLLLHGTAGSAADFAQAAFFDALYGAGEPLDLSRYFLVIPDAIGAGDSSKPSDGLHAHFPHYRYKDQVRAQHLLLERIGIKHLKLVLGTSMGGMQTWLWGEMFPNDMDCLVAIASTPAAISGRNMIWREMISQAIRSGIWNPLGRVFDAFGFGRCMWGTDWTRAVGMLIYEQGVEAFRVSDRLSDSDRAALMGETLQRIYSWPPAQA
ncbi:MAG TPA: alpha/beta fold hydrolase [Stellaceae bacterium]|nr:alpha/beta fold hydrolase [Stellaceae bacterium]